MLQFLPYALAAYGGYKGYRGAKDAGASVLGRLFGAAAGAYGGYTLGSAGLSTFAPGVQQIPASSLFASKAAALPTTGTIAANSPFAAGQIGAREASQQMLLQKGATTAAKETAERSMLERLLMQKNDPKKYDMLKVSALAGGIPFALGAFDQGPVDVYQPTYNLAYADLAAQRPGYSYIDPTTGQEKQYEKVYIPAVSYTHLTLPTIYSV